MTMTDSEILAAFADYPTAAIVTVDERRWLALPHTRIGLADPEYIDATYLADLRRFADDTVAAP